MCKNRADPRGSGDRPKTVLPIDAHRPSAEQQAVTVVLWLFRDSDNRWRDRGADNKRYRALASSADARASARATDRGSALDRLLRKLRGIVSR